MCRWAKYATRISLHIVQEQNLARQVFGELVGEEIFMEVVTSATNPSIGDAKALISFKRIPEKAGVPQHLSSWGERQKRGAGCAIGLISLWIFLYNV